MYNPPGKYKPCYSCSTPPPNGDDYNIRPSGNPRRNFRALVVYGAGEKRFLTYSMRLALAVKWLKQAGMEDRSDWRDVRHRGKPKAAPKNGHADPRPIDLVCRRCHRVRLASDQWWAHKGVCWACRRKVL